MKDSYLVAVSFGTTHADAIERDIVPVEQVLDAAFPERKTVRAFASGMVRKGLEKKGIIVDSVSEALEKLVQLGAKDVLVQPTFIIPGIEYDLLRKTLDAYRDSFEELRLGEPLLSCEDDYAEMVKCICGYEKTLNKDHALVLMGHGTEHAANETYDMLQKEFRSMGMDNVYVSTVEGYPDYDALEELLIKDGAKEVTLMPLLLVAGDHARNDMAGESSDSWKSRLEAKGMRVECILRGLGACEHVRYLFVRHAHGAAEL